MKRYILIILIVVFGIAIFSTGFFIKKERYFDENLRLKKENENLKAELQMPAVLGANAQAVESSYLSAKVFSTYPFNVKNQIVINAGEDKKIEKSMAVLFGENILLGQVIEISKNSSVVQTVFDPNWQSPVRIGEKEINGLLQGGNEPKITFIEKDKPVAVGDIVYSAKQGLPYGLKVGEISEIRESAPGVFKEAILKMPFSISDLREIELLALNGQ